MGFILYIIGLIMIIEGIPWFLSPEKYKYWIAQLLETPEESLRGIGFGMMIFGLLLSYLGKYMGIS
jgi:hypothetical protein